MSDKTKKLTKRGRDKVLALLKSLASECEGEDGHSWAKCRHCLAEFEFQDRYTRRLLRAFIAELEP